jgi:PKD repeat protein
MTALKKFMKPTALTGSFLLLAASLLSASEGEVKSVRVPRPDRKIESFLGYVPDEIVVKFDQAAAHQLDQTTTALGKAGVRAIDQLNSRYNAVSMTKQFPYTTPRTYNGRVVDLSGWYKIKFARGVADVERVVNEYAALPGVLKAEPIGIHTVYGTPNDPSFVNQYHLNQANDHDVDAPEAWDIETGNTSIIVAMLDTGVRYYHKDLGGSTAAAGNFSSIQGNMWRNTDEIIGNGIDDDGNGYIDDIVGYDFVSAPIAGSNSCWPGEDCTTKDNDPRDFNGHGTHCAGNIAAINNNGYATAAVSGGWGNGAQQQTADGVRVMACRIGSSEKYLGFFNIEVGYVRMDYCAEAFNYAANNGAHIASCSWGSSNSGGIADAIDNFLAAGGLIFKAAGNDDTGDSPDYMSGRTDIIAVASTEQNDLKSDFSNYGAYVDVSAPGTDILSLYHNHDDPNNDYIATVSGTSMATPIAASVAALIWSQNPSWSAAQVRTQLQDSADDIDGLNPAYAGKLGSGRVNAFNAVNTGTPCDVVAAFTANTTSGCAPLNVSFTDQSTGPITSWSWNFGDGNTSTAQNPSHSYNAAGSYTVSLTVTSATCNDVETKTSYITVSTVPAAQFTGSPTSGNAPLTVNFTNQSTGGATSWSWNFGDGGTSTAQNPSHQYTAAGTYTVTLTASNACGSDQEVKTNYITVSSAPVNIALNKTATASSTSGSNVPGRACDGSTSTFWRSGSLSTNTIAWWRVFFGGAYTINRVVIKWRSSYYAKQYDIQVSNDGVNFTNVFTDNAGNGGTDDRTFTAVSAQYVRVYMRQNNASSERINEVEVYTAGSAAPKLIADEGDVAAGEIPTELTLQQNYPNPFNPSTTISYGVPEETHVTLKVFNLLGEEVATLVNGLQAPGAYHVRFDARGLPSGIYLYVVQAGEARVVRRFVLMK